MNDKKSAQKPKVRKANKWDAGFINAALITARLQGLGDRAKELLCQGGYTKEFVVSSKILSPSELREIYEDAPMSEDPEEN